MLGCAEQLEAISRAISSIVKEETLPYKLRESFPYLKYIRDKPGLPARQLLVEVWLPRSVSYNTVIHRLAYLKSCGYVKSRLDTKNGLTLYWTITEKGEEFLALHSTK